MKRYIGLTITLFFLISPIFAYAGDNDGENKVMQDIRTKGLQIKDMSNPINHDQGAYAPRENVEPMFVSVDMDGDKKDEAVMASQMYSTDGNESPQSFAAVLTIGEDGKTKDVLKAIPLNELLGVSVDDEHKRIIEVMDLNDDGKKEVAIWSTGGFHYHSLIIVGMRDGKVVTLFKNGSRCPVEYDPAEDKNVISVGREDWPEHSCADGTYLEEIWIWDGKEFLYDKAKSTSPCLGEDEDIDKYWKQIKKGTDYGENGKTGLQFKTEEEEKAWEYSFKHANRGVW